MGCRRLAGICLLILLTASPILSAQQDDGPPWYSIEVIIFAHSDTTGGGERWPSSPGIPDTSNATFLRPAVDLDDGMPLPYSGLPQSAWQLGSEYRRLQRAANMQPLLHTAWVQPVLSAKSSTPVSISVKGAEQNLEGTLQVSIQRYLHVNLDLLLSDQNQTSVLATPIDQPGHTLNPGQYRFTAHRRMRSDELHYIDHPKLGILVQAQKVEFPEPVVEEPEPKVLQPPTTPAPQPAAPVPEPN